MDTWRASRFASFEARRTPPAQVVGSVPAVLVASPTPTKGSSTDIKPSNVLISSEGVALGTSAWGS